MDNLYAHFMLVSRTQPHVYNYTYIAKRNNKINQQTEHSWIMFAIIMQLNNLNTPLFKKRINSKYRNFECNESRNSIPSQTLQGLAKTP